MKTLKEQKWMLIVYASLFIALGLVEFILSIINLDAAIKVVSYSVAGALLLVGLLHIIASFVADTKAFFKGALILGSIAIALGIVLFIVPDIIPGLLIYFVAVIALALGAVLLAKAIIAIIFKYKVSWIIFYFILATLAITFGILALVFNRTTTTQIIYCATGAVILGLGIFVLIYGIKALKKSEPQPQVVEQKAE